MVFQHTAQETDTVSSLAVLFEVDVEDLLYANRSRIPGLTARSQFLPETVLFIPKKGCKLAPRSRGRRLASKPTHSEGSHSLVQNREKVKVLPKSAMVGRDGRQRRTAAAVASTRLVDKYYNSASDSEPEGPAPARSRSARIKSRKERAADREMVRIGDGMRSDEDEDEDEDEEEDQTATAVEPDDVDQEQEVVLHQAGGEGKKKRPRRSGFAGKMDSEDENGNGSGEEVVESRPKQARRVERTQPKRTRRGTTVGKKKDRDEEEQTRETRARSTRGSALAANGRLMTQSAAKNEESDEDSEVEGFKGESEGEQSDASDHASDEDMA